MLLPWGSSIPKVLKYLEFPLRNEERGAKSIQKLKSN
jgi:hypothetical protein